MTCEEKRRSFHSKSRYEGNHTGPRCPPRTSFGSMSRRFSKLPHTGAMKRTEVIQKDKCAVTTPYLSCSQAKRQNDPLIRPSRRSSALAFYVPKYEGDSSAVWMCVNSTKRATDSPSMETPSTYERSVRVSASSSLIVL